MKLQECPGVSSSPQGRSILSAGVIVVPDPYRDLFEKSADAILIIEGETFIDCNDATVKMLRCSNKTELLKTHPSELSPPVQPDGRSSFEKASEMIAMAFSHGSHRFEWMHRKADGEVFPVEVLLTAVEEENRRVLHVVWRDITERKALEEELRQSQKMEAVGKLAGGIAHDFNNLLLIIRVHADLLALRAGESDLKNNIQAIDAAADRAASLVGQLLAFSRKQQLVPRVLDCNQLVSGISDFIGRLIGEDVTLDIKLAPEPLPVRVDGGQIEQVLLNLASNARQAMPHGGRLSIVCSHEVLPAEGAESQSGIAHALLTVSDSGQGMDSDTAARAFEPFFTTKRSGEGTGLGLSTVHGIILQSGGKIQLESALGQGTTFRIYLPLTEKLESESELEVKPAAKTGLHRGTGTILVVEDEDDVALVVVSALDQAGYDVIRAGNGAEGLEAFLEHAGRVRLIVSDVIMPEKSGPAMLEEIRARGFSVPVLFLSGYTDDALTDLRGESDLELLRKPFTLAELVDRARALIQT